MRRLINCSRFGAYAAWSYAASSALLIVVEEHRRASVWRRNPVVRAGCHDRPLPKGKGQMKLYTYYRSQASFRVRIALNLKGIAREDSFLHLEKGDQFAAA
jgi:hypothetical protein